MTRESSVLHIDVDKIIFSSSVISLISQVIHFVYKTHCVLDVVWGHWKYMGSDICLDAHKPKCYVKDYEKLLFWRTFF